MLTEVSGDVFPCCCHCEYPGCPEWNPWHDVRCGRCLRELLIAHREESGSRWMTTNEPGWRRVLTVTEMQDEFVKYVESLDASASTKGGQ